ncbi:MAG: hypothetical protein U0Z53_02355 [Blastocatellia bacterium]
MKFSRMTIVVMALIGAFIGLQIAGSFASRNRAASAVSSDHHPAASTNENAEKPAQNNDDTDLPIKEEINQTFELSPGARVDISRINGSLEIETTEGNAAEIHIVRSARNQNTLAHRRTVIERKADRLFIGSREGNNSLWDLVQGNDDLRSRAKLKLPRKIRLGIYHTSGRVKVGEVDDLVAVSSVNGEVTIAQAVGTMDLFQINGKVTAAVREADKRGIHLRRISGPVEIRFLTPLNADVEVIGLNGSFNDKGLNATVTERRGNSSFSAKIGSGGIPVEISRVNGNVTFIKATKEAGHPPVAAARVKTEVATFRKRLLRHLRLNAAHI